MGRHKLKIIHKNGQRNNAIPTKPSSTSTPSVARSTRSMLILPPDEVIKKKRKLTNEINGKLSGPLDPKAVPATQPAAVSTEPTTKKKDDDDESTNALDKIIRIDKKHSNFDIYDTYANHLLKVRTLSYQINYQQVQGLSQTDHQMRQFWRHINSQYMRKLTLHDDSKFEYFKNFLNQPIDINQKVQIDWEDSNVLLALNRVLDHSMQRIFPADPSLSQLNYANIQTHARITFLIVNKFITDKPLINKLLATKRKATKNISTDATLDEIKSKLEEERNALQEIVDTILEQSTLAKEIEEEFDELAEETNELIVSLKEVNKENAIALHHLESKYRLELEKGQMIFLNTSYEGNARTRKTVDITNARQQRRLIAEHNLCKLQSIQVQRNYLFMTILRLEKQQLAETITCVTGYSRKEKLPSAAKFEVRFEKAYNENPEWMPAQLIDQLNVFRDQSLFSFYNIPQKTLYSHIANNFLGWNHVHKTRTKPNQMRPLDIKEMITKMDAVGNRMDDSDSCHHCKHLFQDSILVKCNYNATTMGLPLHDYVVTDPFLHEQTEQDGNSTKKPQVNRKRNCFSMFQRVNGDLVCQRKYCRQCLKQNYDLILADIKDKPDWVCPFCSGNCYCTRCLRNELLMKYKGIYMLLGGDLNLIAQESLLEHYSQSASLIRRRDHLEKQQANVQSKGTKGAMKCVKLKEEKTIKLAQAKKLRTLSQSASKREKCKLELLKHNIETFREKYEQVTGNQFTPIGPTTYITKNDIETDSQQESMLTLGSMKASKLKIFQVNNLFKKKKKKEEEEAKDQKVHTKTKKIKKQEKDVQRNLKKQLKLAEKKKIKKLKNPIRKTRSTIAKKSSS